MTLIKSYCGDSDWDNDWDRDEPFCATTHRCGHQDCEPCNKLTEIEAQIEDLHSRLKNLHEQHRQVRMRQNNVHSSFIRQLPLEIVTYIFTLTFPPRENPPCCVVAPRRTSPLILAAICHTWRVSALSTPKLWCDIRVDAHKPNFPLLDYQIAHSGTIPLSIHLFALTSSPSRPRRTKRAMSFVIKQIHRTSSFFLDIADCSIHVGAFFDMPDMDYPKAASLLEEIHVHGEYDDRDKPLRLAIEPPRPRRVVLESFYCHHILLDWSNISSATLSDFEVPPPFLSSKNLKHLNLFTWSDLPPAEPVINQSIQELILQCSRSARFMLTATSLPSLRVLELHVITMERGMHTLAPLCCVFLRRSLCPLEVLIVDLVTSATADTGAIQALTTILENTNLLQQLSLRLRTDRTDTEFPSPNLEPLVQRFKLSRETKFLPCLQTLDIKINSIPPFGLLLDLMLAGGDQPPCGHSNGIDTIRRPLNKLILDFRIPHPTLRAIPQDDLLRIFQLRAAGKTIIVTSSFQYADGTTEAVEY